MQCLTYAVNRFVDYHGYNPVQHPNQPDAYTWWNDIPKKNRHDHIEDHSIAIWKSTKGDGTPGHAAYIGDIDDDGTIHFYYANRKGDGKIYGEKNPITFSDPYYMANDPDHVGSGLEFVGYVK